MSGMPGVGKDTWIRRHLPGWPVVSLDDLRQRLQHLVDDPSARADAGQSAARHVASEYDWERIVERTEATYQEVLSKGTGSAVRA